MGKKLEQLSMLPGPKCFINKIHSKTHEQYSRKQDTYLNSVSAKAVLSFDYRSLDISTPRLALAVRIFAKCEYIWENEKINLRSFATFAKGIFGRKYLPQFGLRKILKMRNKMLMLSQLLRKFRPSASLKCVLTSSKLIK